MNKMFSIIYTLILNFRDTSELQKPQSTNAAVIRFYRYVAAAREGQDQMDCLRLFPNCTVQTEKKKKK